MKNAVVRLLTFVGGLFFLVEFLLPARAPAWLGGFENPLTPHLGVVTTFLVVVSTMAFLLGPINLARSHLKAVLRQHRGWAQSAVFLVFLATGLAATALRDEAARGFVERLYDALFYGLLFSFWTTSMAILSFYLVSAAYRAFRVNNLDSGVMMASAVIVLLGQVPLGDWITYALPDTLQLRSLAQWILMVPNAAVQRAVLIGACGGAFATGLRHWLGIGTRQ